MEKFRLDILNELLSLCFPESTFDKLKFGGVIYLLS